MNCHIQCENLVTFLDFRFSQGTVATYCRRGGNVCDVYTENFLTNHLVKEIQRILKIGPHLPEIVKKEKGCLIYLNIVYTLLYY